MLAEQYNPVMPLHERFVSLFAPQFIAEPDCLDECNASSRSPVIGSPGEAGPEHGEVPPRPDVVHVTIAPDSQFRLAMD